MHDRESLTRGVVKKLADGVFVKAFYQVEDERTPIEMGAMRIFSEYCIGCKEKEGSNGKVSVIFCSIRVNTKLGGIASLFNRTVAKSSVSATADPIINLKNKTERLLEEYEPVLEENASGLQTLTWRGQLLNFTSLLSARWARSTCTESSTGRRRKIR